MKRKLAILTCIAMIITLLPTYAMAMDEGQSDVTSLDQLQEMQLDDADQPQVKDEEQSDSAGLKLPAVKPGDADVTPRLKPEGQNKGQVKDEVMKLLEKQYSTKDLEFDEYYDYVEIIRPAWREVIYRGEVLWTDYWQYDTYEDYWTCPIEMLMDSNYNVIFYAEYPDCTADVNDWAEWYGQVNINSSKLAPGEYDFLVINAPVDYYGDFPANWIDEYTVPYDYMTIIIKNFNAPSALKAKAGKKKVTVSFRGSEGATSYQIFRSKKKGSGYKCIATTTKTKYVDKKAKKGKKYYYKVRAVRKAPYKNAIYSGYTAPKKTKKVK